MVAGDWELPPIRDVPVQGPLALPLKSGCPPTAIAVLPSPPLQMWVVVAPQPCH